MRCAPSFSSGALGLPGDKISELKGMDTGHMLSLLVENRLISTPGARRVSDFVGDFNYLGYVRLAKKTKNSTPLMEPPLSLQKNCTT